MASPEDAGLVARSRNGDRAAFSALYAKYRHRLYAFCYRLTGQRDAAEDAVQASFLKAYQSIGTLDDPALFYYWLFSIGRNEALGIIRHRRNGRMGEPLDQAMDVWDDDSPHERVVARETQALVEDVLKRLKPEYREVLILRQYEFLSYAEIAAITGDSISAVESRLFKARKALAARLAPYLK
jgi:RNA polymerase sigma-70 factor, ECF subfamily